LGRNAEKIVHSIIKALPQTLHFSAKSTPRRASSGEATGWSIEVGQTEGKKSEDPLIHTFTTMKLNAQCWRPVSNGKMGSMIDKILVYL
jgi:hypothetical protein